MNSSKVLKEIQELKVSWRRQNFRYTNDQLHRFNELKSLRRERVKQLYVENRVWIGPSNLSKPLKE
jgi:hypothetical protein